MATLDFANLEQQSRGAYERTRLKRALRVLWVVVPVLLVSLCSCTTPHLSLGIGALLIAATVGFLWRGEALGRSVAPGLKAGIVAFSVPLAMHMLGYCCRYDIETITCVVAGVAAGAGVSFFASRVERDRSKLLLAGGVIAALTGSLGCVALGIGGSVGVVGGVMLVTVPFAAFSLARA